MDICYPKHLSDLEPLKDMYSRSRQNSIQNTPSTLKHDLLDADGRVKLLKRLSKTTEYSASHRHHPTRQLPGKPSTTPHLYS